MTLASIVRLASGAVAAAALSVAAGARADSIRCAGGIVATGDSKLDLLGKCGPPALEEGAVAERSTLDVKAGLAQRVAAPIELWTYDLGQNRFVQVVRILKGRIVSIERGSYGYAEGQSPPLRPRKAACDPAALAEGKLKHEILASCGEPAVVDAWQEEVAVVRPAGDAAVAAESVSRTIERFTYDFGPNRLVRFVQFEDGKVTRLETGSYGYAR
jgi:hypothetical protein